MKALLLGGSGQVGTALRGLLPDAIAPTHSELDLAVTEEIRQRIHSYQPDCIVNCAAYTAVDAAEDEPDLANRVNGVAVGELAKAAQDLGIPLVTFSTDYVFDGTSEDEYTESATPQPLNAYGRSKLQGEQLALAYGDALVIRTSWLLSKTHPNFVTTILELVADGTVGVVDDQWGRPTMVDDLADATLAMLRERRAGLVHLASPPTVTWFELARTACRLAGVDPDRVFATSSADLQRPAHRPRHAVLVSNSSTMPDWRDGLREWLAAGVGARSGGTHPSVVLPGE